MITAARSRLASATALAIVTSILLCANALADTVSLLPDISCHAVDVNTSYGNKDGKFVVNAVTFKKFYCTAAGGSEKEISIFGTRNADRVDNTISAILGTKDFGEIKLKMNNKQITTLEMPKEKKEKLLHFLKE